MERKQNVPSMKTTRKSCVDDSSRQTGFLVYLLLRRSTPWAGNKQFVVQKALEEISLSSFKFPIHTSYWCTISDRRRTTRSVNRNIVKNTNILNCETSSNKFLLTNNGKNLYRKLSALFWLHFNTSLSDFSNLCVQITKSAAASFPPHCAHQPLL